MEDLINTATIVVGLSAFCIAGYIMAMRDFRPKEVSEDADLGEDLEEVEPVVSRRELTLSELGLTDFDDIASLPADQQRRLKMEQHVRDFGRSNPEDVAAIIRSWLAG